MMKFITLSLLNIFSALFNPISCQPGYWKTSSIKSPEIFAEGIISAGDYDSHAAFTPGGDTVFFLRSAPDFSTWTICVSYFKNGKWTKPEVAPFSGKYRDADPFVSKDGSEVYFISNRPVNEKDTAKPDEDIWKVVKTSNGWSKPIHLDAPINSMMDEYYPTMTDDGTLYFASGRKGGKGFSDIYFAKSENGKYLEAVNIGDSINSEYNEYEPFISPDEKFMIFMATRPNDLRNADLFVSYNNNGKWTKAEKLPSPINSDATEWSPKVTRNGKYFFFGSTRNKLKDAVAKPETTEQLNNRIGSAGNGLGDIYQVDFSALHLQIH